MDDIHSKNNKQYYVKIWSNNGLRQTLDSQTVTKQPLQSLESQ